MPATVKYEQVAALREKLDKTRAVFVGEYRGMTVAESTRLRTSVRAAGGELKVAKNTLFARAMAESGMAALPEEISFGPNVYALCYGDPAAVAKALRDYAADKANKAFALKGGLLGSTPLDAAKVQAMADLPPRDVMLARAVGTIASPLIGLVTVLSGTTRALVTCLDRIREQKEKAA
ncbi:MAG: 50S ribosomal protein L10 [Synergistaceae bacterium]|jgi:large subunit ribosomal protein L10|nr:50S ribosomal protein L10 [Synergistaceae bacterium]